MSATQLKAGSLRPIDINTFALPEDRAVKLAHAVSNPAKESLVLESEKRRTVFAEEFITNPRLGTLADLCVRALAKCFGPSCVVLLGNDPLKKRIFYDALDIEQPLENLFEVEDITFWRRLVLAKTKDLDLKFKSGEFDWKGEGIALKFVEIVEMCAAEYWPEARMSALIEKAKDFVTRMHIRKLQSLQDYSFQRYLGRDSDTDKATSTDVSYTTDEEHYTKSSKTSFISGEEAEGEEQEPPQQQPSQADSEYNSVLDRQVSIYEQPVISATSTSLSSRLDDYDIKEAARLAEKLRKKTEERRAARRARREAQQRRREIREAKRQRREEEANKPKPKRIKVQDVYDLPIEEPSDDEHKQLDKRNLEKFLAHKKAYKYPPEHCHHIDLRFLRHFVNLVSFAIEFHPPELKENFHQRHFNFSYEDIQHLASGISDLMHLRVFRLRDSRMDATKLEILVASLNKLNVEVIDFGNDQLANDAEDALCELFQNTIAINSLELEGNKFGSDTFGRFGRTLKRYGGVLKYLGLARNPLDTDSLHNLCSKIVNTPQIEELCLAGVRLSELSILCCIGDELLKRHSALRSLDLMAVPLSSRSGEMLVEAMRTNYIVTFFDCRGCNLDEMTETDMALCVKRNIHISKNPYIGDTTKSAKDIEDFLREIKNPILLAALKEIDQRNVCLESRPDIDERFSDRSNQSKKSLFDEIEEKSSHQEPDFSNETENSIDATETEKTKVPFSYKPNEFNREQFFEHVHLPGPGQRYFYFKATNRARCAYIDD